MFIPESELIINPDGSIYHLKLKPGELARRIITVGDPERIELFKPYFTEISIERSNREFSTMTGVLNGRPTSIISTGIGTDNIDIVINEVDALFNIDFTTRQVRNNHTEVEFIRVGTSGAIRKEIDIHDIVLSEYAIGWDGLLHFYKNSSPRIKELEAQMASTAKALDMYPYAIACAPALIDKFSPLGLRGITLTAPGFYGPQSRMIRAERKVDFPSEMANISYKGLHVTNFEMETSGIYGLASVLGHKALSINLILANRKTGAFSESAGEAVKNFIEKTVQLF
ncbi:MAG: nucleoside phosphorylase [Saprospiraceae bacterium]|nr:nucleoside phosphorylase [Saprospiraceae bacterium]